MDKYHFGCATFLTAYHFFMTFLLLEIMCRLRFFDRVTNMPQLEKWNMGAYGVGAVVFMNFNLKFNSVGFYQLSKLSVIPFIILYNLLFQGEKTSSQTLFSLSILIFGMALFTVNDVQLNLFGSIIAFVGVCCVSVFQTKTGSKQKEFNVNGPALQHATSFSQFILALLAALSLETHGINSIFDHHFQKLEILLIFITGFIAVSVNVCSFGLIGRTSAVAYQVVGHTKTVLIFIFGLIMFPPNKKETQSQFFKKITGLIVSMIGIISYTVIQLQEKKSSNSLPKNNQKDKQQDEPFLKDITAKSHLNAPLDTVEFEKIDEI